MLQICLLLPQYYFISVLCSCPIRPSDGTIEGCTGIEGSSIAYKCATGFQLIGNDTRTCTPSGEWTGIAPRCDRSEWKDHQSFNFLPETELSRLRFMYICLIIIGMCIHVIHAHVHPSKQVTQLVRTCPSFQAGNTASTYMSILPSR